MAANEFKIEPNSLKEFQTKIRRLERISFDAAYDAIIGIGVDLTNQAKLLLKGLHVVTSRLMNSIYLKVPKRDVMPVNYSWDGGAGNRDLNVVLGNNEIAYGTNVEYAQKIENLDSYIEASSRLFGRVSDYHLKRAAAKIEKEAGK